MRYLLTATQLCATSASVAQSAAPAALHVADRVRVTAPKLEIARAVGLVNDQNGDALTVAIPNRAALLVIPWADLSTLEVHRPRTRKEGLLHGAKWGLGVGVVLGLISLATPTPKGEDFSEPLLALEAVLDGLGVGAAIGAVRPGRRWRGVDVQAARDAARQPVAVAVVAAVPDIQPLPTELPAQAARALVPIVDFTAGVNFPQYQWAQFPGLLAALAVNVVPGKRFGAALVGEFDNSLFRDALMGGGRVYFRGAPLLPGRGTMTGFGQVLGGDVRAERSGVVHSNGGRGVYAGLGVEYSVDATAFHLEAGYRSVPGGVIDDERVAGRHVGTLSGMRVVIGATYHLGYRARH